MTNRETTKSTLAIHGLVPSKKRGQNFLINRSTAELIIAKAGFHKNDNVVEIGVGLGALTLPLADKVASVYGIEFDRGIIRYHQEHHFLPANVQLHHEDILKTDFRQLSEFIGGRLKLIANLPYSISNPFIFKLIENRQYMDSLVVMLQKEVVDRLCAQARTKAYGIPTVLLASCASIERLLTLGPSEFHPKPKIDSQVIRIVFFNNQKKLYLYNNLKKIVRSAFAGRRKTLANNLAVPELFSQLHDIANRQSLKKMAESLLQKASIDPQARAETLTVEEFERLAEFYEKMTQD